MATLDILTAAEAQTAALDADSGHEAAIARMNTAVSVRIDELVGPVVKRAVTEYHDGGEQAIWPRQTPLATVTTLKEWDGSTITTLTEDTWGVAGNADGFVIEQSGAYPHDVAIYRRSAGDDAKFVTGHRAIQLVYQAGRAADTASVEARYKECATEILRRLWDREASAWARGGADPFDPAAGASSRFFKAFDHVIAEHLGDEMKTPGLA